MTNPEEEIRSQVLKCTNQFLMIKSPGIWNHFEEYMQILYRSTADPSFLVKRWVRLANQNSHQSLRDYSQPIPKGLVGYDNHSSIITIVKP
jgi:serine/threonine protein phosphatase PrpC